MMSNKLKLFVWEGVLVDCTPGIAFAMAHNVDEARGAIIKQAEDWVREHLAGDISKEPTHIYDDVAGGHVYGGG
jgi:hypothetical protein